MTERVPNTPQAKAGRSVPQKQTVNTANGTPIRILVVDEQPVVREGLAAMLKTQDHLRIVEQASDIATAIRLCPKLLPDVVLFDLAPSIFDSIRAVFAILEDHPAAKIVIFTASQSEEHIYQATQAGVKGYLLKTSSAEQIIDCIQAVFRGDSWMPQPIAEALVRRMSAPILTPREREVLRAMAEGKSNREIGEALKVSEGTVKVHMTHILEKLRVDGRTGALAAAAARGLVSLVDRPTPKNEPGRDGQVDSNGKSSQDGERERYTAAPPQKKRPRSPSSSWSFYGREPRTVRPEP